MDPVTMILAALAAGVATGAGAAAAQAFKDGYAGLKGLLKRRFAGNAKAHETLADFEADPDTYEKPLAKLLKETGADQDPQILAAAERLVAAAEHAGVRTKYHVSVTGCGQVGAIAGDAQVTVNAPTRPQEPGLAPVQPVGHDSWSAYPRIDVDANREVRPEVVVIDEPFDVVVGLAKFQDVAITQTGGMRFQVRAGMEVDGPRLRPELPCRSKRYATHAESERCGSLSHRHGLVHCAVPARPAQRAEDRRPVHRWRAGGRHRLAHCRGRAVPEGCRERADAQHPAGCPNGPGATARARSARPDHFDLRVRRRSHGRVRMDGVCRCLGCDRAGYSAVLEARLRPAGVRHRDAADRLAVAGTVRRLPVPGRKGEADGSGDPGRDPGGGPRGDRGPEPHAGARRSSC